MSLPTKAIFRDKEGNVLAEGSCNPGWKLAADSFIPMVREALVDSRVKNYILSGGKYNKNIFGSEDEYERVKLFIERTGVTIEKLREEHGERYFSEGWQRQWNTVEIFGIEILRSDLMTASTDALYEEEFVKRLYQVMKRKGV